LPFLNRNPYLPGTIFRFHSWTAEGISLCQVTGAKQPGFLSRWRFRWWRYWLQEILLRSSFPWPDALQNIKLRKTTRKGSRHTA
jgi:hypothetical protein